MEHTHIVKANNLSDYADIRNSQEEIPDLVYRLVRQSVPNAPLCRIPSGNAVSQPGPDGIVVCENGYLPFVPDGNSCWEIGTGRKPQDKASADFLKRTKQFSDSERAEFTFVFVTPRSIGASGWTAPEQRKWINRRRNRGWKGIKIIDGVDLANWLREFPALGRWMATKANITRNPKGISTPLEHWELILHRGEKGDPALPPALFTTSRDEACSKLESVFAGKSERLFLFSESEHDVDDFVAAYLLTLEPRKAQEYADRCLFIDDEDAWRSVSDSPNSHILVANTRLGLDSEQQDLQTVATGKGHGVVIPLYGVLPGDKPEIIRLRSPSAHQIEEVLKDANFSKVRAQQLGSIGDERISALRRHFLVGSVPPYVKWDTVRQLAQASLAGQWNAKTPADVNAMKELLGKEYREWIEILRTDTLRSDSPLTQSDERWKFVARSEAWNALGNQITAEDLDRFKTVAVSVLGEQAPEFDLPKEERFMAGIHGQILNHSQLIRTGLAETLALIGSRPQALTSCSIDKAEATAIFVVRSLLNKAGWERWASLDSLMPLLAEASPNEFLKAVESVLGDPSATPFHEIFAQEGTGMFGSGTYMSGLLWALEGLAWNSDYLPRVSLILADIASIDPGGNYTNRPANSLANIFLPWHVQTTAPFDKRKATIKAILQAQPKVGWSLLLALLPQSHGSTSGSHRPVWREYIPCDWKEDVTMGEYWEQITALTELAVEQAEEDTEKLVELADRLQNLPKSTRETILDYLSSDNVVGLPEFERLPIWEKLDELVRRHRRFSDAGWALSEEVVEKIEKTANRISFSSPEFKYRHLFSGRDFDIFNEKGNYKEQRKRLDKARQAAVSEILNNGSVDACFEFATTVMSPDKVGCALGVIASNEVEGEILPSLLDSEDDTLAPFVAGFTWARYKTLKTEWVDTVLARDWAPEHKAKFLTLLPFNAEIWERVASHLGKAHEVLYWRNVQVDPYNPIRDFTVAIEKLLKYEREGEAVVCVARTMDDVSQFDETLATCALVAVINSGRGVDYLDIHQTVELIKRLQESETTNQAALFLIEWSFLPSLDGFSSGSPITLEKRLASDPAFFAEAVRTVFRSKNKNANDIEKPDEKKQDFIRNAYRLLTEWKRCPGIQNDGTLDVKAFKEWIDEARRITEETGHAEVAQVQIGHMLTCAPADPDGLWIHKSVAEILNSRDTGKMRSGFTIEILNQRGVYTFTHGQGERELARENRNKADALDSEGYTRFATAMRDLADQYDRDAKREGKRDPFEDW